MRAVVWRCLTKLLEARHGYSQHRETKVRALVIAITALLCGAALVRAETPELKQLRLQLKAAQDANDKPAIAELSRRIVAIDSNLPPSQRIVELTAACPGDVEWFVNDVRAPKPDGRFF